MSSTPATRVPAVALLAATAAVLAARDPGLLQVGQLLPRLEGEFLSGRKAVLPAAADGRVALVMMGFTYQSRFPVEAWGTWFRGATGRNAVTWFEVPMIGGPAKLGGWFIDRGMRNGTPRELHENVTSQEFKRWWKSKAVRLNLATADI